MYDVKEDPVGWLLELIRTLSIMSLTQLTCGAWTAVVVRSKRTKRTKWILCLSFILPICILSSKICDADTHFVVNIVGAVAFCFTTPLQACGWALKDQKVIDKTSIAYIIIRTAIPAAIPTEKNPAEKPLPQFIRAWIYILIGSICGEKVIPFIEKGGLYRIVICITFITTLATGALTLVTALLGFIGYPSPSPFRRPILSPTVGSFWSGRWNAAVSDSLRVGIYDPLINLGFNRSISAFACFLVSAIAHELILIYCGFSDSHGEWFIFFTLSGVITLLERKYKPYLPKGIVGWMISATLVIIPFNTLFVPVAVRIGVAQKGVEAVSAGKYLIQHAISYLETRS